MLDEYNLTVYWKCLIMIFTETLIIRFRRQKDLLRICMILVLPNQHDMGMYNLFIYLFVYLFIYLFTFLF